MTSRKKMSSEGPIRKAIDFFTQTHQGDNKHKATVCVTYDQVIIGTEHMCCLSKEHILENQYRLSVQTYDNFYDNEFNPIILVQQYQVDDLRYLLLSPRAHQNGNTFDACSSCVVGLRPNQARISPKPLKCAIANGFVIGHVPCHITTANVWDNARGEPVKATLPDTGISKIMSATIRQQCSFIFCDF